MMRRSQKTMAADDPRLVKLSLTDILSCLGLTHRSTGRGTRGAHHVMNEGGEVVFTGNCFDVTDWLRASGRIAGLAIVRHRNGDKP